MGRVACETLVTTGLVMVAGEITTKAVLDYSDIARDVIRDVGYTRAINTASTPIPCAVISSIKRQSPDIAMWCGHRRCRRSRFNVRLRLQ